MYNEYVVALVPSYGQQKVAIRSLARRRKHRKYPGKDINCMYQQLATTGCTPTQR